ncbi:TolB-like translocation protein [Undibacterium umbellatum]|uniref:Uncharacterized protein n=1 Tax=Undibacterium umbellatum TaxID=2762300 RepID=A0ABR6ZCW4_9BURK|nr:hypothetical protein [Undibacterium umbellatum]MBC3909592.1 hypothetical protein [Undibacterium umbellatum]
MQTKLLLSGLLLSAFSSVLALSGCKDKPAAPSVSTAVSADDSYKVSPSPFARAAYSWCDATHLAITVKSSDETQALRNLYLDLAHPDQAQPIEFSDEQGKKPRFSVADCRDNKLLIAAESTGKYPGPHYQDDLYLMPLGKPAQLLMVAKDSPATRVSLSGKYLLASMPRTLDGNGYKLDPQCTRFASTEFKTLCWDVKDNDILALSRFVIQKYLWQDRVSVRVPGAGFKDVPNTKPAMQAEAGKPAIENAILLKDLNNKLIARLDDDPQFETYWMTSYTTNPDESMLYAACKRKGKSAFTTDFDKVCRYRLDGAVHAWEEVFSFPLSDQIKKGIQEISIDAGGNVYFSMPGSSGKEGGIWKFDVAKSRVIQIVPGEANQSDGKPSISADGKTLVFEREGALHFAYQQGEAK